MSKSHHYHFHAYFCRMRYRIRSIIILIAYTVILPSYIVGISQRETDKVLMELDRELDIRASYIDARQHVLDSLRQRLNTIGRNNPESTSMMLRLGEHYAAFNNDSALFFFGAGVSAARKYGQDSLAAVLAIKKAELLPLAGFAHNAVEEFSKIDTIGFDKTTKVLYLNSGRQMYSYLASFFRKYPDLFEHYTRLSTEYQKQLIDCLDDESVLYRLNLGEYCFGRQEYAKAETILSELSETLHNDDNLKARALHILSSIAKAKGHHLDQIYYLANSAMTDIRSATLEVTSLQELGTLLFEDDDITRANNYLSAALKNAVDCHASLRVIETSESMPLITSAHNMETQRHRNLLVGILFVLVILLVGMILLLVFLRSEMRRMHVLQENLRTANKVKEVYLSQFLNLCSIYMDKLNNFCKIAHRKISTGKVDDLYKMTKSGKFVEEQSREFYDVFDDAFLHIYPTFLDEVNALLRPDERIELKDGEKLNTDLRILAFMRLGIEESARIAQVLNYSVYTIYTYRNKLKNRAIKRDTFESDIMNIGALN